MFKKKKKDYKKLEEIQLNFENHSEKKPEAPVHIGEEGDYAVLEPLDIWNEKKTTIEQKPILFKEVIEIRKKKSKEEKPKKEERPKEEPKKEEKKEEVKSVEKIKEMGEEEIKEMSTLIREEETFLKEQKKRLQKYLDETNIQKLKSIGVDVKENKILCSGCKRWIRLPRGKLMKLIEKYGFDIIWEYRCPDCKGKK